jgi:hypothetical protein
MDDTRPNDGLHNHVLKYFWTRVLDDGVACETQFDLETGEERGWTPPPPRPLSQVAWVPFSPELAEKVTSLGQPAVSLPIPPIVMDLDPRARSYRVEIRPTMFWGATSGFRADEVIGDQPIFHRSAAVHLSDYYLCSRCGTAFTWDGTGTLECPECKTRNQWFCSRCKSLKLNPKFYPRGEVRCPDCEVEGVPHGLLKINNLVLMSFSWLETIYNVGIEGKFKLSFGEEEIRIEH